MKLDAVKTAIGLMGEYVRLSEILENVGQGVKLEVYLENGDDIGHIEGMTEGIINRITDARNTIRSKLKYSFNIPVDHHEDEPELPLSSGVSHEAWKPPCTCRQPGLGGDCDGSCFHPMPATAAVPAQPYPRHQYGCPCGACSGSPDRWSRDRPGAPAIAPAAKAPVA